MSSSVVVDPAVLVAAEEGRPAPMLPHQRDAEEAVLGSVLLNPEVYFEIAQLLAAEDFFLHRNRWIWESFSSLQEQRLPDRHPDRVGGARAAGSSERSGGPGLPDRTHQ